MVHALHIMIIFLGNITNQVIKTKYGHICVLPTEVVNSTSYVLLTNPKPGTIYDYCTLYLTGPLKRWPWCSYGKKFPETDTNGYDHFITVQVLLV